MLKQRSRLEMSLTAAVLLTVSPVKVMACSCIYQPLEVILGQATFIAGGHVTAIRESNEGGILHNLVSFTVWYGWKGQFTVSVDVWTGQWDGDCGYPFLVGHDYILVGGQSPSDGLISASLCSGTVEMRDAADHLGILGPPPIVATEAVTWSGIKTFYR